MKTKILLLIIGIFCALFSFAQKSKNDSEPKLILDLPILDLPYLGYGIQSRANSRKRTAVTESTSAKAEDYIALLESPSMYQVMGYSSSFYNAMNYGIAKAWNN